VPSSVARVDELTASPEEGAQRVASSLGERLAGMDRTAVDRMIDDAATRVRP
jgi:hypothetical protein